MSKKIKKIIGKLKFNKKILIIGNILAIIFFINDINSLFDWQAHNNMKREIKRMKNDINKVENLEGNKKNEIDEEEKKLKEEQLKLYNSAVIEFNNGNYEKSMNICSSIKHNELLVDKDILIEKIKEKYKKQILNDVYNLINEDEFGLAKSKLEKCKDILDDKEIDNLIKKINSLNKVDKNIVENSEEFNGSEKEAITLIKENLGRTREGSDIFVDKQGIEKIYEESYYFFKVYIDGKAEEGFDVVSLKTMIHYKYYKDGELILVR